MTALNQYQRLEAVGTWRETPKSQRRDVIVSVGDATLVLTDPRSDIPLAHWSLPAVVRLNPGKRPALYSPGAGDVDEKLEVEDDLMIAAIEKVHRAIDASRPNSGRMRASLLLSLGAVCLFAAVIWLPPAIVNHAAQVAPPAQRSEIGQMILGEIEQITGNACQRPAASAAARDFAERLLGPGHRVAVLPTKLDEAIRLPGPVTVIGSDLISGQHSPEVAAGYILAAEAIARRDDPLFTALRFAGPRAAFHLLTSGDLTRDALDGYGERLLKSPPAPADDERLLKLFEQAGVSSVPYARALDPTGEATLGLIEADPFRTALPAALLDDREWVALQQICDE
ncbi:hypothetical protein [Paracoccus aminophilus]|uniref:Uncharacterized protein n=1 Tax=Paracoccus aminophilus JCM 7686 TaxID=1367847 RepID=S5YWH4_PARAH|nr:hypothetical protein [Paracoccus aminophilus]AGT09546.1 hypothetical protein JCM7686_2478 [Paracoccus aminophilus JCM 7686]